MTNSQKLALEKNWLKFGLNVKEGALNLRDLFGRDSDVILEIGFGMGEALAALAQQHPENDFIGVEVHHPGIGALFVLMKKFGISNIRVFQEDVNEVLDKSIPNESLAQVNIFFPDPWPKKRHHKRRLIQSPFVELLWQKLKEGGKIHLATDWQNYAEQMMQVLSAHEGFNNLAGHGRFVENQMLRPVTKFEKRGKRLGHDVWDLVFIKMK